MSKIINLVQGSPEWHEHRRLNRNASESAAVLGISPWLSPHQLWLLKTGRAKPEANAAMRHGTVDGVNQEVRSSDIHLGRLDGDECRCLAGQG